jgi:FAD-linked oxidoreductase
MKETRPPGPAAGAFSWRNWAGDQRCRPALIELPRSVQETGAALDRARGAGMRVRVAGSGHSFSDIACTDGLQLRLHGLSKVLDVDRSSGLVRVQGGITIHELSQRLAEHDLALENLGDIDAQTIAGAISTATHGTGAKLANIPAQVQEMTLVLADGSTLACSHGSDPETFRAARVGLGALGVIAEVTLRCVPAFCLRAVDSPAPLQETLDRFEELSQSNDHFEFYVFPYAKTALHRTNNRTDEPPRPPSRLAAYVNDVLLVNAAFGLFCKVGRGLPSQIPAINRLVTRLAGSRVRVDRSDRVFATPRLVRFTEMEYALPRANVAEAVRRVLAMVERERLPVPFPIEVRSVAADDAFLSTAAGRESGFVAVHMFEGMAFETYFRAVEAIMDELDGRPHWGKRHFQTAATLRPRYPDWDRFQAIRARLDPTGVFSNAWTDRVLGPVGAASAERSA